MGKYKEIQIEVSDEVYSALEQLADDLNKAETIILNRTGKQELIGQRSMTVEHIALLAIETYVHNKKNWLSSFCRKRSAARELFRKRKRARHKSLTLNRIRICDKISIRHTAEKVKFYKGLAAV